jgi:hypothetical protein
VLVVELNEYRGTCVMGGTVLSFDRVLVLVW